MANNSFLLFGNGIGLVELHWVIVLLLKSKTIFNAPLV